VKISVPKETKERENRVSLTPDVIKTLVDNGFECTVEKGAGLNSYFSDEDYISSGAKIADSTDSVYSEADVLVRVNPPSIEEVALMKSGSVLISFLFAATNHNLADSLAKQNVSSFAMDAIPRISRAQKMDALSSQSNLGGYKAVLMAANELGKVFPLLMTAAGTLKPSRVVIMGAGVAGLQAIATAKRLGAIVEVSDIRPETKEQIESLGGTFIEVKGDDSVETQGGYVKEVSAEYLQKQKEVVAEHVSKADIVITTALIPGKKAPMLIPEEMVKSMRFGSVILDMAVEQGGNCELSELNKTVVKHGVSIIGESNLPSRLPLNASELYAKNISTLLLHLADNEGFKWEMEDEITIGSLITHKGDKVHPSVSSQPIQIEKQEEASVTS
jgi:NAD(P) transhydrogenase subunit alpha